MFNFKNLILCIPLYSVFACSEVFAADYQNQLMDFALSGASEISWVDIGANKNPRIRPMYAGGASQGGHWKIHISIDPMDLEKAYPIVLEKILSPQAPNLGAKFASSYLLNHNSQPGKAIALVLADPINQEQVRTLLQEISDAFIRAQIKMDPRPINSDEEAAQRKWDASIFYHDHSPSYFNYRETNHTVLENDLFDELAAEGYTGVVRKSAFLALALEQRHNPLGLEDPLAGFSLVKEAQPEAEGMPATIDIEAELKSIEAKILTRRPGLSTSEVAQIMSEIVNASKTNPGNAFECLLQAVQGIDLDGLLEDAGIHKSLEFLHSNPVLRKKHQDQYTLVYIASLS